MDQNLQLQLGLKLQEVKLLQLHVQLALNLQELQQQQALKLAHQVLNLQHQDSELLEWQVALILGEAHLLGGDQGEDHGEDQGEDQQHQAEEQEEGGQTTLMLVAISEDVFQLMD